MSTKIAKLLHQMQMDKELVVKQEDLSVIVSFVSKQKKLDKLPDYNKTLLDTVSLTNLLTDAVLKEGRELYGLYKHEQIIGYAVVYRPEKNLDLLYIEPKSRGLDYGVLFISALNVNSAVVNKNNQVAIALYKKANIKITYDND